ncbi:NAD(P)H-hydrate dehydratase [Ramlibacter sp. MMS24-I3-19]|uniref:NAD(P)H-hydrate dehydratase n=1 Tax=Ramlibacter sp. MMS24-I3-19 TaxID=3416606 RepID=UPI003D03B3BC
MHAGRIQPVTGDRAWPLFDVATTRAIERAAAAALPPHALMQRAGLAASRLALAIAPHARTVWIACGPGNNGGDGLEAALLLQRWGKSVTLTLEGDPAALPADAAAAWARCTQAGLTVSTQPPTRWDLCIDALLGIGSARPLQGAMATMATRMQASEAPVLAIDVPSGLAADTGAAKGVRATHTLALLTLKPGLFTASGRDASGQVWFDDLGVAPSHAPAAWLAGPPPMQPRAHASHKGSYGDVAVLGGAPGMSGAAVLAASGALHAGAGRVFLCPLDPSAPALVAGQPELMVRDWRALPLENLVVACGCGGGDAVAAVLPDVLPRSGALVLDADGLNAIAADAALQAALQQRGERALPTVLTPHPLEAARLLGTTTPQVQADRIDAARALADHFGCAVVLKGSGSVVAAPGEVPRLNPTGNARLATGGTGDVLAGFTAALLAGGSGAFAAACAAVHRHGMLADRWPAHLPLTAGALARAWSANPAEAPR